MHKRVHFKSKHLQEKHLIYLEMNTLLFGIAYLKEAPLYRFHLCNLVFPYLIIIAVKLVSLLSVSLKIN